MIVYLAQRDLRVVDRENNITVYHFNEEIPNFETWNIVSQRSHLELQWVIRKQKEELEEDLEKEIKKETLDLFRCHKCMKEFNTHKGLEIHFGRAHK